MVLPGSSREQVAQEVIVSAMPVKPCDGDGMRTKQRAPLSDDIVTLLWTATIVLM